MEPGRRDEGARHPPRARLRRGPPLRRRAARPERQRRPRPSGACSVHGAARPSAHQGPGVERTPVVDEARLRRPRARPLATQGPLPRLGLHSRQLARPRRPHAEDARRRVRGARRWRPVVPGPARRRQRERRRAPARDRNVRRAAVPDRERRAGQPARARRGRPPRAQRHVSGRVPLSRPAFGRRPNGDRAAGARRRVRPRTARRRG